MDTENGMKRAPGNTGIDRGGADSTHATDTCGDCGETRAGDRAPGVPAGAFTSLPCPDIRTVSTAALAYLGDAVIEVLVRERLVAKGLSSSKALNRRALDFVRASAQAAAMERLLPFLDREEEAVFRRGRNVGHTNTPKNATVAEYRNATGMETLFGYLHLTGKTARAAELFLLAYEEEIS